ncbi:MFS transporter [Paenibacillus sp. UNC499MF]|uniref:MFS transporter n=1 Tax=Paenibacillus sp. UNC499MF TaxID=1502751 RepID=UPI0008A007E6|nr:MFS transporter [Paenibacillus sp. UNC499MF]SEG75069.1 MFS transporter, DHA2 family, metal-tetracycline-proton antiporter [Paenibacillus sp. UNC499MF]
MNVQTDLKRTRQLPLLLVLVFSLFVACMTADMVNPVLHLIRKDFGASEAGAGWVVSGVLLVIAIGVPIYGRISDFFSIRKLYAFALLIFAAGSLVCAAAPTLPILVGGRMLQGAGSAAVPVLSVIAVSQVLPSGSRGAALGLLAGSIGLGTAAGPIFGGLVGQIFGWPSLFWLTLALLLALVPCALYVLPGGAGTGTPEESRLDLPGGILFGLAAGLFLFGVTQGQTEGFRSPASWGSLSGACLLTAAFIRRIFTAEHPFVPPALFADKSYSAAVWVGFFTMFAYVSSLVFVPLLVVEVNGLSPAAAGLVLLPGAAAVAVFSPAAGRLSDRIGVKIPVTAGLSLMGISLLFISTFAAGSSPLLAATGMLGLGLGVAFTNSPANNAAANTLGDEQVGAGLGIFQGALFLGAGTGASVIGAFLAARKEDAQGALNPFYVLDAAPYSDAFLAIAAAVVIALVFSAGLQSGRPK